VLLFLAIILKSSDIIPESVINVVRLATNRHLKKKGNINQQRSGNEQGRWNYEGFFGMFEQEILQKFSEILQNFFFRNFSEFFSEIFFRNFSRFFFRNFFRNFFQKFFQNFFSEFFSEVFSDFFQKFFSEFVERVL